MLVRKNSIMKLTVQVVRKEKPVWNWRIHLVRSEYAGTANPGTYGRVDSSKHACMEKGRLKMTVRKMSTGDIYLSINRPTVLIDS
jgi:hypothetical protein